MLGEGPGVQSAIQFIPKVEVKTLCKTHEFSHTFLVNMELSWCTFQFACYAGTSLDTLVAVKGK